MQPPSPIQPVAPPMKKQRASGDPAPPPTDVASQRRAELQRLQQSYNNRPTFRAGAQIPPPQVGFHPGPPAAASTTSRVSPRSSPGSPSKNSHIGTAGSSYRPRAVPPPAVPNRSGGVQFVHQSDIFPTAPKAPPVAPVVRRLEVSFQEPRAPPSLAPEASPPPVMSMQSPPPANRVSFAAATPDATPDPVVSPLSVSRTRLTADTPYASRTPAASKAPSHAGHTPFATKTFSNNAGQTPFPTKKADYSTAGQTPFPTKTADYSNAGQTPFPTKSASSAAPPSTSSRREALSRMHEMADTPPKASASTVTFEESVELRLQKQLATTEREKAAALRQVAELEDELTQTKLNGAKSVGFLSPHSPARSAPLTPMARLTPTRRRMPTPHPKLNAEDSVVDLSTLQAVAETLPHEFEDGDVTFVVRRPYGLADEEQELWFRAGERNAKMYKRDATYTNVESIELTVQIHLDESLLVVYAEGEVRHQNPADGTWTPYGNYFTRSDPLGDIAYIDSDANEKEYSLDEIADTAMAVREHYCGAFRTAALGFQRRGILQTPPTPLQVNTEGPPSMMQPAQVSTPTADACVGTEEKVSTAAGAADPAAAVPREARPLPPDAAMEDPSSDVFSTFIGMLVSLVYFFVVKVPCAVFYTTFIWALTAVCLACIYILVVHYMGSSHLSPGLGYYHNQPGIM